MPDATPDVEKRVAEVPVLKFARSAAPLLDPASMTYAVGVLPPIGGSHCKVTLDPDAEATRFAGGAGSDCAAAVTAISVQMITSSAVRRVPKPSRRAPPNSTTTRDGNTPVTRSSGRWLAAFETLAQALKNL